MASVAIRNIYGVVAWYPPDFLVPRRRSNFVSAINLVNNCSELVKTPGTEVLSGLRRLLPLTPHWQLLWHPMDIKWEGTDIVELGKAGWGGLE